MTDKVKVLIDTQIQRLTREVALDPPVHGIRTMRMQAALTGQYHRFSLTYEALDAEGELVSCGFCPNAPWLFRHFPEFEELLPWHLCDDTEPIHYVPNSLYWAGYSGYCDGCPHDPPNLEHLKTCCVYGVLEQDTQVDLRDLMCPHPTTHKQLKAMRRDRLQAWLEHRLPDLLAKFRSTMEKAGFTW